MSGAFEAVDADGVDPDPLGLEGMPNGHGLVDDLHPGRLEGGHVRFRVGACGFDDRDPALDNRVAVLVVGHRIHRRQDGEVDAERLVGEVAHPADLRGQRLGGRLRQGGEEAERSGLGHGRDEFGLAHGRHAAADDRVVDSEDVGEACLDHSKTPTERFRAVGAVRKGR